MSDKSDNPYFRVWQKDEAALIFETGESLAVTGMRHRLRLHAVRSEARLPADDDKLARRLGISLEEWLEAKELIVDAWELDGDEWVVTEIEKELDYRASKSRNGGAGWVDGDEPGTKTRKTTKKTTKRAAKKPAQRKAPKKVTRPKSESNAKRVRNGMRNESESDAKGERSAVQTASGSETKPVRTPSETLSESKPLQSSVFSLRFSDLPLSELQKTPSPPDCERQAARSGSALPRLKHSPSSGFDEPVLVPDGAADEWAEEIDRVLCRLDGLDRKRAKRVRRVLGRVRSGLEPFDGLSAAVLPGAVLACCRDLEARAHEIVPWENWLASSIQREAERRAAARNVAAAADHEESSRAWVGDLLDEVRAKLA